MSAALLALALLGVAGWFLLLARGETHASQLRVLVEAVSAETVIAALIAVDLVSFGAFRPATDAAVLSTMAPAEGRAFAELPLERRFTQRGIVYPTDHSERLRAYYLYDLVFAGDGSGKAASPPTP